MSRPGKHRPKPATPAADHRKALLAGATAFALALTNAAAAQQQGGGQPQAPSQRTQDDQGSVVGQLQTVERSLRFAERQLAGGEGDRQAHFAQARTAAAAGQDVLVRLPQQAQERDAFHGARRDLLEAQQALLGQQPDRQRAATRLRGAADAVSSLAQGLAGGATAAGATGSRRWMKAEQRRPQADVPRPAWQPHRQRSALREARARRKRGVSDADQGRRAAAGVG